MPQLVTDPDILRQLNAPDVSPPIASSTPASAPSASTAQAPSGGMRLVTDPDLLRQLNAPQGTPGAYGLVWGQDGGRDAQTGELVVAGKPFSQNAPSQGLAAASSALSGIPVVGPSLEAGAEKAGAYLREKIYGDPANQTASAVQGDVARSQAAYPKTALAGSLAGGVIGTAPLIAAAPGAFGVGDGGLTVGNVAAGTVSGAGLGAADAAARSGGNPSAVGAGAFGGAVGGAAGPVIGAAASRVAQPAAEYFSRAIQGDLGVSRPVADIITRAAVNDGTAAGTANIAAAGPNAMLADAGPNMAGVLDTALQRGGTGTAAARQAIEGRAAAADQSLTAALDQTLGAPQGVQTATDAIRTGSAPARQTAYDTAYASPIDYTSAGGRSLEDMITNRVPPGIIARANAQMRMDGTPSQQIMARIQPDGSVTYDAMPDVRQIDYITRSLNDVAQRGDGQGALGGNTAEGRSYGNLARDLRDTLRQAVPEYGTALDTAAQPIQARNALEFGSTMLSPSVPRDVAAETIGQMTAPELAQARQGIRSQIADTMANVQRTITDPNTDARSAMSLVKQLSSDAAQDKLGMILHPNEQRFLQTRIAQATRAIELRSSVATNSRTFARTITNDTVQEAAQPSLLSRMLMAGGPLKATRPVAEVLTGNTPAQVAARQDALYGELAQTLTGPRGPAAQSVLDRILQAHDAQLSARSTAAGLPYGAVTQTGLLSLLPALQHRTQ